MVNRIRHLWDQLSKKDQRALYFLSIILGPLIFAYLVIVPISDYKQGLLMELEAKEELNQWLSTVGPLAQVIVQSKGLNSTVDASADISSVVISIARQYNIELQKFEVDTGAGLRVWFTNIRYDHFVGFLSELGDKHSIYPENLIIDGDKPGIVSVRGTWVSKS